MTATAPTLFFGVGATKSGTSWLHDMLASHPRVHFRAMKELHYFSMFDLDYVAKRQNAITELRDKALARLAKLPQEKRKKVEATLQDRKDFLELCEIGRVDEAAYLRFVSKGAAPDASVIGEITPAYSLLSVARLRAMAALAERTKFVFVMRDPVARLWSNVRMEAGRETDIVDAKGISAATDDYLQATLSGDDTTVTDRGDYPAIIARLRQAIPADDLLLLFYEEMFTPEGVEKICNFLGLDRHEVDLERRVHPGNELKMSPAQRTQIRSALRDQYHGVAQAMGYLPDVWKQNMTAGVT